MVVHTESHDLREVLAAVSYPADKWAITACADIFGVDVATQRRLYGLPVRTYRSETDAAEELGLSD